MTIRSVYLLGLLAGGVLSSTSLIGTAVAAAAHTADATTGWSVNRIASASAGTYCAMTQQYNDDTMLTLAKNRSGEYSMAFDFNEPMFKNGKETAVTLRPLGAPARTYQITPQSSKLAIIGIGPGEDIIQAMTKSGDLGFEVAGKATTFKTSAFGKASDELSRCASSEDRIADASQPTASQPTASQPTVSQPTASQPTASQPIVTAIAATEKPAPVKSDSAQMAASSADAEMQKTIRRLQDENTALKSEASKMAAADSAASATVRDAQTAIAESRKENADLKARLDSANKAIDDYQAKLAAGTQSGQQVAALSKENDQLKSQLEGMNRQVGDLQAKVNARQEMTPEDKMAMQNLQNENERLKAQLTDAATVKNRAEDEAGADKLRELRDRLAMAEQENRNLKSQIETVQAESETRIKAGGNNWDLEQATRRYQEAQREIRRLSALIEQQQSQFQSEKKELQTMLFDPALTEKAQIAKFDSLESQVAQLEDQIRAAGGTPATSRIAANDTASVTAVPVTAVMKLDPVETNPVQVASTPKPIKDNRSAMKPVSAIAENSVSKMEPVAEKVAGDKSDVQQVATIEQKEESKISESSDVIASAVISPATNAKFQTPDEFSEILSKAGISLTENVETVSSAGSDSYRAYRWKTPTLYGSAEQRAMRTSQGYEAAILAYLKRAKSRCGGEFKLTQSAVAGTEAETKAVDISCNSENSEAFASLLFMHDNGVMTIVAHEGKGDAVVLADQARDSVAKHIGVMTTASRS